MSHYFCTNCGICPFSAVANLPLSYEGRAKIGARRVNLGCVDGLNALELDITLIDGKSL
jgi:hypothetical protein